MKTDLFHIYPTDGWVNNKRGNLPLGTVSNPNYTSGNGSKVGTCSYPGYSGQVFEPIDEFKGDLARSYFYMSVCYKEKNLGQTSESMFEGSQLKLWAMRMLLEWHYADPVSQKEIDRNNAVYAIQHNRNPFIDCPYFADAIWNDHCDFESCLSTVEISKIENYLPELSASPNPTSDIISISSGRPMASVSIFNITWSFRICNPKGLNINICNAKVLYNNFQQSSTIRLLFFCSIANSISENIN